MDLSRGMETNALMVEADGPNDIYRSLLRGVSENGDNYSSRGMPVRKIGPVTIIFLNPRERFLTCPGRLIHPYFQVLESIWILGGKGNLAFISYYLKNMEKYADNREEFHAPYGVRMRKWGCYRDQALPSGVRDQFFDCFSYLRTEPDTRHAVMTFWNPKYDNWQVKTNDRPCNITFQFLIEEEKLNLYIFNRSNDVNWGLFNTNVVQFSVILETMALLLGIPVGRQIHMITNLHVYDYQNEITKRVLDSEYDFNIYDYVKTTEFEADYSPERRIYGLDNDLRLFFEKEAMIRKGRDVTSLADPSMNYLNYALKMACSFYEYKRGNISGAIDFLMDNSFWDIQISCFEFLARKAKGYALSLVDNYIRERFDKENYESIIRYINGH